MAQKRLSDKQKRFVQEYLVDLNATQAYIRAGYSPTGATASSSKLLANPNIKAHVAAAQAARATRVGMDQDDVLRETALLAQSDIRHYSVDDEGKLTVAEGVPDEVARAVSSIKFKRRSVDLGDDETVTIDEVEIKLWPKGPMIDLASKHLGMVVDRRQVDAGPNLIDLIMATQKGKGGDK